MTVRINARRATSFLLTIAAIAAFMLLMAGSASAKSNNGNGGGKPTADVQVTETTVSTTTTSTEGTETTASDATAAETTSATTSGAGSSKAKSASTTASSGSTSTGSTSTSTATTTASSANTGANDTASLGGQPTHGCAQADENDGDPYDSTCDGSPSLNGNGGGTAGGKPCAGCVGAADNKNPPGQMPNGSDANNGYECDGNSGIGKTNPAHTGCVREPYSGAAVDTPGKSGSGGAKGPKKTRLTGYELDGGPAGSMLVVGVLGLAAAYAASRKLWRLARR